MMDEILALLLQDHSSSDEEKKESTMEKPTSKDCRIAGQHCGNEESENPDTEDQSPPFSAAPDGGRHRSINDISSLMVRQPPPERMDFASVFRDLPPLAVPM